MSTFDAPSRELCTVRRIRTNTPLQAFVTLNDPVYVEAAQALARRIVREGGTIGEDRVRFALRLCLGRHARARAGRGAVGLCSGANTSITARTPKPPGPWRPSPWGRCRRAWRRPNWRRGRRWPTCCLNLDGVLTKG